LRRLGGGRTRARTSDPVIKVLCSTHYRFKLSGSVMDSLAYIFSRVFFLFFKISSRISQSEHKRGGIAISEQGRRPGHYPIAPSCNASARLQAPCSHRPQLCVFVGESAVADSDLLTKLCETPQPKAAPSSERRTRDSVTPDQRIVTSSFSAKLRTVHTATLSSLCSSLRQFEVNDWLCRLCVVPRRMLFSGRHGT
jgi:hypothetical protein